MMYSGLVSHRVGFRQRWPVQGSPGSESPRLHKPGLGPQNPVWGLLSILEIHTDTLAKGFIVTLPLRLCSEAKE